MSRNTLSLRLLATPHSVLHVPSSKIGDGLSSVTQNSCVQTKLNHTSTHDFLTNDPSKITLIGVRLEVSKENLKHET
jgi:hypothetical protein